jgi:hypothetical protein
MSSVSVEATVKCRGGGKPEEREPQAKHQERSGRLGEATDAVECGVSAQRFEIKQNDPVRRKENLRANRRSFVSLLSLF